MEPADPPEEAGMGAIERWKTASKKYHSTLLEDPKKQLRAALSLETGLKSCR